MSFLQHIFFDSIFLLTVVGILKMVIPSEYIVFGWDLQNIMIQSWINLNYDCKFITTNKKWVFALWIFFSLFFIIKINGGMLAYYLSLSLSLSRHKICYCLFFESLKTITINYWYSFINSRIVLIKDWLEITNQANRAVEDEVYIIFFF